MPAHDPLMKELLRTFFPDFLALVEPQLHPQSCQFLDKELAFTGKVAWARAGDSRMNVRGRFGVRFDRPLPELGGANPSNLRSAS